MVSTFRFERGCIATTVDLTQHRLLAVQKAAYRLAARCTVILGETAYEVEAGFVAKPLDSACTRAALVAAMSQAGL